MNRLEVLKTFRELLNYNLLCYSENYLMSKPKKEYIEEWESTQERLNIIEEMIVEEERGKMSFTQEQIIRMYPNVQYYVRNSNGGLLAGTVYLKDAKKYAEEYKREYLQDKLNNHVDVFVYDKHGHNIYVAKGIQNKTGQKETEEFE